MTSIGTEALDIDECWSLVTGTPVGRVGFDTGVHPTILPIVFSVHGRSIVFRTAPGDKLIAAVLHKKVCFEADDFDPDNKSGWSVNVVGTAEEVTDSDEVAELEKFGLPVWAAPEVRNRWVRIVTEEVSGRRLVPGPAE